MERKAQQKARIQIHPDDPKEHKTPIDTLDIDQTIEFKAERRARILIHSDDPKDHEAPIHTLHIDKVAPRHIEFNEFGTPFWQRVMTIELPDIIEPTGTD